MKKAHLITIEEYQANVTPLLKEFKKFIKKNGEFLIKGGYDGIVYLTWEEYFKSEKERDDKTKYFNFDKEHYIKHWLRKNGKEPNENVPTQISETHNKFIEQFTEIFGIGNLTKIQDDELKSNKRSIRRAIDDDSFVNALLDKEITSQEVEKVFAGVGIKIPKNILQMKEKVELQGYDRTLEFLKVKRIGEFETRVREVFAPHKEILKENKRKGILYIVENFEKSQHTSVDRYAQSVTHIRNEYNKITSLLYSLMNGREKTRIENFDKSVENKCEAFAESFIIDFIFRINEKLLVINNKIGVPSVDLTSVIFSSGIFEGVFKVNYDNGTELTGTVNLTPAGGYNIQEFHYRYLIYLYNKGVKIDMEKLDKVEF